MVRDLAKTISRPGKCVETGGNGHDEDHLEAMVRGGVDQPRSERRIGSQAIDLKAYPGPLVRKRLVRLPA